MRLYPFTSITNRHILTHCHVKRNIFSSMKLSLLETSGEDFLRCLSVASAPCNRRSSSLNASIWIKMIRLAKTFRRLEDLNYYKCWKLRLNNYNMGVFWKYCYKVQKSSFYSFSTSSLWRGWFKLSSSSIKMLSAKFHQIERFRKN